MSTPTSFPLHVVYVGHRNKALPYSLVIRHGTHGQVREQLETILRCVSPFATKLEAVRAKDNVRENLRPFVAIETYHKEDHS